MGHTERQQKDILDRASKTGLKYNIDRIINNVSYERWLRSNNSYEYDTISKLESDVKNSKYKNKEINEYIAASILTHCLDAWSYFGRAISSILNGDLWVAKHILYYAELRSAMSILASQGIGVFDKKHFVIRSKDRCEVIKGPGTHTFVWGALDYWFNAQDGPNMLLKIIKPDNINLDSWLDNFSIQGSTKRSIALNFLNSIGFDLKLFYEDKDARNQASYRPTTISDITVNDYAQIITEVKRCWDLCEPKMSSGLNKMDKILLKRLFHVSFKATHVHNCSHKQANKQFERKIENTLINLGYNRQRITNYIRYFSLDNDTEDIFKYVDDFKDKTTGQYVFGMIYRTLFLLRISSAFVEYHLSNSILFNGRNLNFWWSKIGANAGLWELGNEVSPITDLWQDISMEISDLENWVGANPTTLSQAKFQSENPVSTSRLCSFERVCLWSVGL